MGAAGRDRRVRTRKSRQPGRIAEEEGESEHVVESEVEEPASASDRPSVEPSTRAAQTSPTRKRGRVPTTGRTPLSQRVSLLELVSCSLVTLVHVMIGAGFLQGSPKEGSCKCKVGQEPEWKLEERDNKCYWRCKKCRNSVCAASRRRYFLLQSVFAWSSRSSVAFYFESAHIYRQGQHSSGYRTSRCALNFPRSCRIFCASD